jgi:DNA-binding LacI/PurR family transcriptional regulator
MPKQTVSTTQERRSKAAFVPIYRRIETELRQEIERGAWPVGAMLPGRRDLAKQYDVDLTTIERAVGALLDDGTLRAEGRRGTFVSEAQRAPVAGVQSADSAASRVLTIGITAFFDEDAAIKGTELPATITIVKAIEDLAASSETRTRFINRWSRSSEELDSSTCAKQLLAEGADCVAIVDAYTHPRVVSDIRRTPELAELPVVYVSAAGDYVPCSHVYFDNKDAGFRAADSLLSEGYRDITFLAPYSGDWQMLRAEGARIACESSREPASFRRVAGHDYIELHNREERDRMIDEYLSKFADTVGIHGGIIVAHDVMAYRLMVIGESRGLKAGLDYGLVGFDDDPLAFSRGLTTIRPPLEEMGTATARLALSLAAGGDKNQIVSLRAQVIARNTHLMQGRTSAARKW